MVNNYVNNVFYRVRVRTHVNKCKKLKFWGLDILKDTLADNPKEKLVMEEEDISVTTHTEEDLNFDVTKAEFGSFSWDT